MFLEFWNSKMLCSKTPFSYLLSFIFFFFFFNANHNFAKWIPPTTTNNLNFTSLAQDCPSPVLSPKDLLPRQECNDQITPSSNIYMYYSFFIFLNIFISLYQNEFLAIFSLKIEKYLFFI